MTLSALLLYNYYRIERDDSMDFYEIKLTQNQKLILKVLQDEFGGQAHGPEMLDLSENEEFKKLSINQITWNFLRLRENGLVTSEKTSYKGRILNEYKATPYISLGVLKIK